MPQTRQNSGPKAERREGAATAPEITSSYQSREQLAERYRAKYGPISPRTLERWPLVWRFLNGRAVADVAEFDAECARRFMAAPAIRGGAAKPKQAA